MERLVLTLGNRKARKLLLTLDVDDRLFAKLMHRIFGLLKDERETEAFHQRQWAAETLRETLRAQKEKVAAITTAH